MRGRDGDATSRAHQKSGGRARRHDDHDKRQASKKRIFERLRFSSILLFLCRSRVCWETMVYAWTAVALALLLVAQQARCQIVSWDDFLATECGFLPDENCEVLIPSDTTVTLDSGDAEAASVTVEGRLVWGDTLPSVLTAGYVVAQNGGSIEVGSSDENPAPAGSGVYLKDNGREYPNFLVEGRSFGSFGAGSSFRVHGSPLGSTWLLLSESAGVGETTFSLEGNPLADGWKVGDRIAIAPTSQEGGNAEVFTLAAVFDSSVIVDGGQGLSQARVGDPSNGIQAEVINLSRTVTITGDDFDFRDHGLHVIAALGGVGVMRYARVEKGGQRGVLGRYPVHFHLVQDCPQCQAVGNAVEDSFQRGIVLHGTSGATVSDNVLYGVRGAGIYVEDGNELENTVSFNVNICPSPSGCTLTGTDNLNSDNGQQSGVSGQAFLTFLCGPNSNRFWSLHLLTPAFLSLPFYLPLH